MSDAPEAATCGNCGGPVESDGTDRRRLCAECLRLIVERSTRLAVLPTVVVGLLYGWMLIWTHMFDSRFLMLWIALGVALGWVTFKVSRRVLFEVVHSRGVRREA